MLPLSVSGAVCKFKNADYYEKYLIFCNKIPRKQ